MSHVDDIPPYRSRDDLFETIRQQRIQLDQKDDKIRKLEDAFMAQSEHVEVTDCYDETGMQWGEAR